MERNGITKRDFKQDSRNQIVHGQEGKGNWWLQFFQLRVEGHGIEKRGESHLVAAHTVPPEKVWVPQLWTVLLYLRKGLFIPWDRQGMYHDYREVHVW